MNYDNNDLILLPTPSWQSKFRYSFAKQVKGHFHNFQKYPLACPDIGLF